MDKHAIDKAVQQKQQRQATRKRRAEQRRLARIHRINQTKIRIRDIQEQGGSGLRFSPKPIHRYFMGFDISQGFWFALVTGIVLIFPVGSFYDSLFSKLELQSGIRILMSLAMTVDTFALLYIVFAFFLYPPIRLIVTNDKNYALYVRNNSRPRAVGRINELHPSISFNEKSGWGSVEIRGAGRTRAFLKLRQADVEKARQFFRHHKIN